MLNCLQGIGAGNLNLAHVADIEQPGARPHRHVLVDDAGVFDWHVPAAKFDHPGTGRAMTRVERGFLQRSGWRQRHRQ